MMAFRRSIHRQMVTANRLRQTQRTGILIDVATLRRGCDVDVGTRFFQTRIDEFTRIVFQ
jgi:hypothetical protein